VARSCHVIGVEPSRAKSIVLAFGVSGKMPKKGVVPITRQIEAAQPLEAGIWHLVNVRMYQSTHRNGRGRPDERFDEGV
jgi:hypothetical protein